MPALWEVDSADPSGPWIVTMASGKRHRPLGKLLLLTAATAGMVAGWMALARHPLPNLLAQRLGDELQAAPQSQVEWRVRQIAQMGEPGIPVLVAALGSERTVVADAAREAIWDEIAQWEKLPVREALPRVVALAQALGAAAGRFDPAARADAACLATRLLQWPLGQPNNAPRRMVAACESVLRLAAADGPASVPRVAPWEGRAASGQTAVAADGRPTAGPAHGRQPLIPGNLAALLEQATDAAALDSPANPPQGPEGPLPVYLAPEPPAKAESAGRGSAPDRDRKTVDPNQSAPMAANQPMRLASGGLLAPSPASDARSPAQAAPTDTLELIRQLQATDPSQRAHARSALAARGLKPAEIEIGQRLFDPDPAVRRRLARSLPSIPGIDAAPWLMLMARDQDAEVRRTAAALLVTTGDPALVEELRRVAREDPDGAIREQLERLDEPRLGRGTPAGSAAPTVR
jgi:hypothetical protein